MLRKHSSSYAATNKPKSTADINWFIEYSHNSLDDLKRFALIDLRQQNNELVTTDSGDSGIATDFVLKTLCTVTEDFVTDMVSRCIVDDLKSI